MDTGVYTTEFTDGEAISISANTASESIFQNFDADGNIFMLFKSIMDHKSTENISRRVMATLLARTERLSIGRRKKLRIVVIVVPHACK